MSRATVCLGFDFDAVSVWIHSYDAAERPTSLSRGTFGAEVAVPRILDLLDRVEVTATFFTPGHTIESFPEICGDIWHRGHEIQHHGWSHRSPSDFETKDAERADIERGIDAIRELTGQRPTGYRAPSWDFSIHTLDLLVDLGFEWDSSQMARDFEPYYLRTQPSVDPDEPYEAGMATGILEIPVAWYRDDWPIFQFVSGDQPPAAGVDPGRAFEWWHDQFEWMYEHVPGGVFPLTFHPQVIGQAPVIDHLEDFLGELASNEDVAVHPYGRVAEAATSDPAGS